MPRVRRGPRRRQKRKKILARAKGYYQAKSKLYRYAREAVDRGLKFAYIGRRLKKRDFRSLWIIRIGAGARRHGLSYSRFVQGLKLAGIELNRKMLAEMAVRDPDAFGKLAAQVSRALEARRAKESEAAAPSVEKPAATKARTQASEIPPPAEAAPAEAVKAEEAEPKATREAEAAPAKAVEPKAKETQEAPPAKAKTSKKVRKPAAKKAVSKTAPEKESDVSGAAPKAAEPSVKPSTAAKKRTPKPAAKPSTAAKPRKSSVGAKKKAAESSKASPKSKSAQKTSETTSSD